MKKVIVCHLMVLLIILAVQSVYGQRTVRMNLERMVTNAGTIVHGTVVKVETKNDPESNILSTFVTIDVKENFYGANQSILTIKMLGGSSKVRTIKLAEMPAFSVGEEIVGMFYAPSKLGFSSPVGMGQGKFSVINDAKTNTIVAKNSFNNKNLFAELQHGSAFAKTVMVQSPESLPLADLSQSIRSLVTILKK
jgi:hypothetical protein